MPSTNIISLATFKEQNSKRKRLADHTKPYCGKCYDESGEIQDLITVPLQYNNGDVYYGWFCIVCESEFN